MAKYGLFAVSRSKDGMYEVPEGVTAIGIVLGLPYPELVVLVNEADARKLSEESKDTKDGK